MQGAQHRRPARADASPALKLCDKLSDGEVRLVRDQCDQAIRDLAPDRRHIAAALGPRGDVSGLAMPAEHTADGCATHAQQRRDLFVAEPALVESPDDRFAKLRRSSHSNRRSQFTDHINRIAG
jgi:hypothetical protein